MFFWQAALGLIVLELFTSFSILGRLGVIPTILLWLAAAAIGSHLVQKQGLSIMTKAQQSFDRGAVPVNEIFDGFCVFLAGALLILPGFLSDFVAFALLVPYVRAFLRRNSIKTFDLKEETLRREGVIEGEYVKVDEEIIEITPPKPPSSDQSPS